MYKQRQVDGVTEKDYYDLEEVLNYSIKNDLVEIYSACYIFLETLINCDTFCKDFCNRMWLYLSPTFWFPHFLVLYQLFQDQIQMLLDAFKNPPVTREEGLYFGDKQYKCVRADKNSIYAKHVRSSQRHAHLLLYVYTTLKVKYFTK